MSLEGRVTAVWCKALLPGDCAATGGWQASGAMGGMAGCGSCARLPRAAHNTPLIRAERAASSRGWGRWACGCGWSTTRTPTTGAGCSRTPTATSSPTTRSCWTGLPPEYQGFVDLARFLRGRWRQALALERAKPASGPLAQLSSSPSLTWLDAWHNLSTGRD